MSRCALYRVWIALTDAEETEIFRQFDYDPEAGDEYPDGLEDAIDDAVAEKVDEVMSPVKANPHTIDYELIDMGYC